MAKLKFKDEDGEFIPVVQDVLVNNNSVFDGKDANIELKTINSQSITGSGNIEISPSSKVDILLSPTPDQEGFLHSKYSPDELWDMYNDEETFLTIDGQLIANATYEGGEFSCALLFAKEVWTPIYVTMYVVRPNDDNKLRKTANMPAASADFTINGHKLSDNMGVMTLTPEDLAYVNTIKGTAVTTAKGALDALTTNVNDLSTVEANPTLAGTESDLTAIEVAGTKYKIPSGGSGGGNTTTIQSSWETMPQNPSVGDRVTNVNDNSGTPGGGGGGNTTVVQTSWDNMPSNPSVGDRVTNLNDTSGFKFLQPEIDVSAPIGTEITVTDGTTTYTKTSTEEVTKFNVNDYGTWTVSGTFGSTEKSKTVYIDAVKIYGVGFGFVPIEYREVEYLEATGTQYIQESFAINSNLRIVTKMQFYDLSSANQLSGTKAYLSGGQEANFWWGISTGYFGAQVGGTKKLLSTVDTLAHTWDLQSGSQKLDGVEFGESTISSAGTWKFGIGCRFEISAQQSVNVQYQSKVKIYYFDVYDNSTGEKSKQLVPCYRISDNEPGLYDLVNDTFYTNDGTGTFNVGDDV